MSTLIEAMVEADRPPAGTPCVVCKGNGHWCQAEQYATGDAEAGICNACVEGQDCSYRLARRRRREVAFELDPQDRPPAPMQTVPLAVQTAQPKEAIQLPAPVTTSQPAPVPTSRFEAIAARLLKLDQGETVTFVVPEGMTVKSFDSALLEFLASYPLTEGVKWIHTPDPTKTRLIMATMKDLKKGVSKAKIEKPVKLEREVAVKSSQVEQEDDVNTYKPEQRAKAEAMLKNGYGTQVVQARTGLARNTVIKIKRELGMPVGQQPSPFQTSTEASSLAVPAPQPRTKPQLHDWTGTVTELLRLNVGDWINLGVPDGFGIDRFANNLRTHLGKDERARTESWSLQTSGFNGKVHATRNGPKALPEQGAAKCDVVTAAPVTIEQPAPAEKPELKVATPVTIVTVPADAPQPDMTLSRAFELVIAEIDANVDSLKDTADDSDEELADCIKSQEQLAAELRDSHPAFMGTSATGAKASIYERAMDRAESELHLINLEIQRLTTRRDALKPVLAALKASATAERDTR